MYKGIRTFLNEPVTVGKLLVIDTILFILVLFLAGFLP